MNWDRLAGNGEIKKILEKLPAQSFVISGCKGSGRRTLAEILAASLLCVGREKPCGTCPACKKAAVGTHPDLKRIGDGISPIGVDDVRFIKGDSAVFPSEASAKVYIINGADMMTPQAQNSLLKTLEEPPSFAYFILTCTSRERLLDTVLSRCLCLAMKPVSQKEALPCLEKKFPRKERGLLSDALARCGGFIGPAEEYLSNDADGRALAEAKKFFLSLAGRRSLLLLQENKRDRGEFAEFLSEIKGISAAVLRFRISGEAPPLPGDVTDAASVFSDTALFALCELCDETAYAVSVNANMQLRHTDFLNKSWEVTHG